jgi:ubiquinone biosynthesis protein UbiJ
MTEREAYITGDIRIADLLGQIDDLKAQVECLEDVLAALLTDDNEKTRDDATRALCS